jgi:hypothetical protein
MLLVRGDAVNTPNRTVLEDYITIEYKGDNGNDQTLKARKRLKIENAVASSQLEKRFGAQYSIDNKLSYGYKREWMSENAQTTEKKHQFIYFDLGSNIEVDKLEVYWGENLDNEGWPKAYNIYMIPDGQIMPGTVAEATAKINNEWQNRLIKSITTTHKGFQKLDNFPADKRKGRYIFLDILDKARGWSYCMREFQAYTPDSFVEYVYKDEIPGVLEKYEKHMKGGTIPGYGIYSSDSAKNNNLVYSYLVFNKPIAIIEDVVNFNM